ncbi:MAG: MBOAT family protein [Eubacteriales bacterium]
MVFSSLEFLFLYLPVTLLLYFAVPKKYLKWRNVVLLITSLIFYGWGEPVYVFLMISTIIVDYICGYFIDKFLDTQPGKAKGMLIAAIVINLGILGIFKYYDFIVGNLRLLPGLGGLPLLGLELPIGISFYTFQALSYVLDVYRRDARVQKNVATFGAYVTLYPQLIAGPIVRYQDVDDMLRRREESIALFSSGVRTFLAGFAKKILLANIAGQIWSAQSAVPLEERTIMGAWIGMICYSFQIYFDFSGYSDMAIGLGKMIGFKFLENFNYPYIAKSITDFWRRWHMSLSTWFREYVYFPLGGSRCSAIINIRNLFIVWLLTGFWHGASWNYILWGLYYFALLVIEKQLLLKQLVKLPAFFQHVYALFFILFGWLLFVFEDLSAGMVYLGNMFGVGTVTSTSQMDKYNLIRFLPFIIICVLASTPLPRRLFYRYYEKYVWVRAAAYVVGAAILVLGVSYLVDSSYNPFLYFRF